MMFRFLTRFLAAVLLFHWKCHGAWLLSPSSHHQRHYNKYSPGWSLPLKMAQDGTIHEKEDWRDFRARLVAQEQRDVKASTTTISTPTSSSSSSSSSTSWAYQLGDVIEQGSVILSRHEHDFCYGLKQQYFHKSIMLVLEHAEGIATNGIILNRPSSRILTDADGNSWNIWYGGPVRGIGDKDDELAFTCLHSSSNDVVKRLSNPIIKDIQWTTLDTAQFLVREKHAVPQDFQVYCGFACWSPGQLQRELERNNWYMASIDSQTILQELLNRSTDQDDFDVLGMETWKNFAERIGRVNDRIIEDAERFDDCMLSEWIGANLMVGEKDTLTPDESLIPPTRPLGTLLRASGPFLLDDQEFHKSLLLVLEDTPVATVGVLLNLPGADNITIGGEEIPIRYGGKFGIQGQTTKPITWYHNDDSLRNARVGRPIGASEPSVWTCTQEDVETAILMGLASLDDFLVTQGATVLKKDDMQSVSALGRFQVVARSLVPNVWDKLLLQRGVSRQNSDQQYMSASESIWELSKGDRTDSKEGTNESDDKSAAQRDLNAVAWKSWVSCFLLHDPKLRGS